jgi:hypothetical protein
VDPDGHRPDDRRRRLGGDGHAAARQRPLLGLPDLRRRLHPDHLGGAVGCFLPPLFALVQFPDSFWPALILFAALQG